MNPQEHGYSWGQQPDSTQLNETIGAQMALKSRSASNTKPTVFVARMTEKSGSIIGVVWRKPLRNSKGNSSGGIQLFTGA